MAGFNGATTVLSWNTYCRCEKCGRRGSLQWGHDGVVVEYPAQGSDQDLKHRASMGPRRCCRGIPVIGRRPTAWY